MHSIDSSRIEMNSSLPNPTDAIPQLPPDVLRSLFDLWNVAVSETENLCYSKAHVVTLKYIQGSLSR